jgi:hypothetical protein
MIAGLGKSRPRCSYLVRGSPGCPSIDDIDVQPRSLSRHSHIAITDEQGREAERLIARAAEKAGSVGACYTGPPPRRDIRKDV